MPDHGLPTSEGNEAGELPRDEVKRRASAGVSIVATRGLAILLIGAGGNIVLARLLTPDDFGVVAIGMAFVMFISLIADGGLGAGLIRRAEPPTIEELQALTAFQLSTTIGLTLLIAGLAAPFGEIGQVTALMACSMPLAMLQIPGRILLERSLSFQPLAAVEISQVLAYYACAIGLVTLGFGVWGLAIATVAMGVVAAFLMARVSPVGLVQPHFSWRRVRPLLGFGVRLQANSAIWLVRDQGLNVSLAAIAGVSSLGLWSLARRLLDIPYLLFVTLFRVSFPTMSQLVARKEDVAPLMERAVGISAVGGGVILTGLVGSAPGLIPGLFGAQWQAAVGIIPLACLGLGIAGPVSVATQGYLFAVGDASAVLRSTIVQTIALFAVTLPLVPVFGVSAVGLGLFVSFIVEAVILRQATLQWTRVRLFHPLIGPLIAGVVSAGIGWFVDDALAAAALVSGLVGGACSVLSFLAIMTVLSRGLLRETIRFAVRSMQAATKLV